MIPARFFRGLVCKSARYVEVRQVRTVNAAKVRSRSKKIEQKKSTQKILEKNHDVNDIDDYYGDEEDDEDYEISISKKDKMKNGKTRDIDHMDTLDNMSAMVKEDKKKTKPPLSSNQKFRNLPIDPVILNSLDLMHLGYISTRKARVVYARKLDSLERDPKFRQELRNKKETPSLFRKVGSAIKTVSTVDQLQSLKFENNPPEVAIIGRSNVGKSSLLNRLLGYNDSYVQKSSVSDKPGETRNLIFYGVRSKPIPNTIVLTPPKQKKGSEIEGNVKSVRPWSLILTDMPGYGFGYLNETDKQRCMEISREYILHRGKNLKRVLLLLDARHGFKVGDKQFFQELLFPITKLKPTETETDLEYEHVDEDEHHSKKKSNVISNSKTYPSLNNLVSWKIQIVLTKCDLVERNDIVRRMIEVEDEMSDILKGVPSSMLKIIPLSSLENKGVIHLQKELASLVPASPSLETISKSETVSQKTNIENLRKLENNSNKNKNKNDIKGNKSSNNNDNNSNRRKTSDPESFYAKSRDRRYKTEDKSELNDKHWDRNRDRTRDRNRNSSDRSDRNSNRSEKSSFSRDDRKSERNSHRSYSDNGKSNSSDSSHSHKYIKQSSYHDKNESDGKYSSKRSSKSSEKSMESESKPDSDLKFGWKGVIRSSNSSSRRNKSSKNKNKNEEKVLNRPYIRPSRRSK